MLGVVQWVLYLLGVTVIIAGVLAIIYRRRFAANMRQAGLARKDASYSSAPAIGIGVTQLGLGILLLVFATRMPRMQGATSLDRVFLAIADSLDAWLAPVVVLCAAMGAGLLAAGIYVVRKVWDRRGSWRVSDQNVEIPRADRSQIVLSVLSLIGGLQLLALAGALALV